MSVIGYNGGIVGPDNTPTTTVASGVWTIEELFNARDAGIWPLAVPAVVKNAAVWLDAADLGTITEVAGAVSQWDNKGTLGNFTQAVSASQPTTGASTLNSLNVLDFADDFITSADTAATWKFLHDGTTYLVAAVWKPGAVANPLNRYALIGTTPTTAEDGAAILYKDTSPDNDALQIQVHNSTGSAATIPVLATTASGFISANNFHVSTMLVDPDNGTAANRSEAFNNAGSASKTNTNTGTVSSSDPSRPASVGRASTSFTLTGSIAELVVVSGADATESNRVIIRDYLNAKWSVY